MQQKFDVKGSVSFPLVFPITCDSYESAVKRAESVLNNKRILKVEMEFHCSDGKIHLAICDELTINWLIK